MSDEIKLPEDRELALHEVNSILTDLRSRYGEMHFYSKKAWRRDRITAWVMTGVLLSALAWVLFYQYARAQELRQSLYEVCVTNVSREDSQRALYQRLADTTESTSVRRALLDAADQIEPRDCSGSYLSR